jgi:alpha-methylacyl-CoA racemase
MTGYGQIGPFAQAAGHDLNYLALTGVLDAIGPAQGPPLPPLNLVADYGGGAMFLAFGVMAALFERQRSGLGQVVDAAMVDGVAAMAGIFQGLRAAGDWQAQRGSNLLDGGAPFYACYTAADGQWLAVAALEPKFFAALVQGVGLDPAWIPQQHERQRWPALRAALTAIFKTRSRDAWCELLAGTDACVSPVLSFAQAPLHAHAQARAAYVSVGEGVGVGHQVAQPAAAPRLGRSAQRVPGPAPGPGSHTVAILQEAGLNASEIQSLLAAGVAR